MEHSDGVCVELSAETERLRGLLASAPARLGTGRPISPASSADEEEESVLRRPRSGARVSRTRLSPGDEGFADVLSLRLAKISSAKEQLGFDDFCADGFVVDGDDCGASFPWAQSTAESLCTWVPAGGSRGGSRPSSASSRRSRAERQKPPKPPRTLLSLVFSGGRVSRGQGRSSERGGGQRYNRRDSCDSSDSAELCMPRVRPASAQSLPILEGGHRVLAARRVAAIAAAESGEHLHMGGAMPPTLLRDAAGTALLSQSSSSLPTAAAASAAAAGLLLRPGTAGSTCGTSAACMRPSASDSRLLRPRPTGGRRPSLLSCEHTGIDSFQDAAFGNAVAGFDELDFADKQWRPKLPPRMVVGTAWRSELMRRIQSAC
eukprot:TRINITY_DN3817_c0_g1_i1.p1 TRINITY_DN3817_c0_g1~~TRINITY_DN3817_c0_g1_i1.p1  ORF type:complete len:376 (-),score=77.99 TRINITY_DN3817_c0_g1_i1:73-1200(-)